MEPSTDEMHEIAGLAKTFSTACKEAVEESKAGTETASVVMAALVLTASATIKGTWL